MKKKVLENINQQQKALASLKGDIVSWKSNTECKDQKKQIQDNFNYLVLKYLKKVDHKQSFQGLKRLFFNNEDVQIKSPKDDIQGLIRSLRNKFNIESCFKWVQKHERLFDSGLFKELQKKVLIGMFLKTKKIEYLQIITQEHITDLEFIEIQNLVLSIFKESNSAFQKKSMRWNKNKIMGQLKKIQVISKNNEVSNFFENLLKIGISSLKTPMCQKLEEARKSFCPVCSSVVCDMAKELPCTIKNCSVVFCQVCGMQITEQNPAYYKKEEDIIICKRTLKEYEKLNELNQD